MKLLVCALLIACCGALGYFKGSEYKKRCDFFYTLSTFCNDYSINLKYSRRPLLELFDQQKNRSLYTLLDSFRHDIKHTGREGGCDSADGTLASRYIDTSLRLSVQDERYIRDFICTVGDSDSQTESEKTEFFAQYFNTRLDECEKEYRSKGKLCQKLGIAMGVLLSILTI